MKYLYYPILLISLNVHTIGFSQSTQDLFTIPGLTFVIDVYDDTGQFSDGSLYYMGDTIYQDTTYHIYENKRRQSIPLYIDGYKVFYKSLVSDYQQLLFDFGIEIGDSMIIYQDYIYVLESKGIIQLEDGIDRIEMNFVSPEYPNWNTKIIEGIGYQKHGMFLYYNSQIILQCASTNDNQIFLNEDYSLDECDSRSCPGIETSFEVSGEKENINFIHHSYSFDSISLTFGDGVYFDDFLDSYSYQEEGCYKIELEVFNECGESSYHSDYYNYCTDPKWQKQSDISIRNIQFLDKDIGFGRSWDKVYKTVDGGSNWTQITLPQAEEEYMPNSIYFSDNQNGVIVTSSKEDNLRVIISSDGGNTWEGILEENYNLCDAVRTENGDIFAISARGIYRTKDNGINWTHLDIPYGWVHGDFQLTQDNVLILAQKKLGNYDFLSFLYISTNNGDTWKEIDMTFDEGISSVHFFNALNGYVGMKGDLYRTDDGGDTWENVLSLKEGGGIQEIDFESEEIGVLVANNIFYRTIDGGSTWQVEYCDNSEIIYSLFQVDNQYYSALKDGFYKRSPNPDFDCDAINSTTIQNKLAVEIAPNPTTDYFHIIGNGEGSYQVEIRDIKGAVLLSRNIFSDESIDIADLSMGLYLVSIQKDDLRQTFKLVKN